MRPRSLCSVPWLCDLFRLHQQTCHPEYGIRNSGLVNRQNTEKCAGTQHVCNIPQLPLDRCRCSACHHVIMVSADAASVPARLRTVFSLGKFLNTRHRQGAHVCIEPGAMRNSTHRPLVTRHEAGVSGCADNLTASPVNVHMALNQRKNLRPVFCRGVPGHRLRSMQARFLPESVTGNSYSHRLQVCRRPSLQCPDQARKLSATAWQLSQRAWTQRRRHTPAVRGTNSRGKENETVL
jgi:hypothetical protein